MLDLQGIGADRRLIDDLIPAQGELLAWTLAANRLFAFGCEGQSFMLLASFSAPMCSLWKAKEGSSILSAWGGRKSGVSTACIAAASVWSDVVLGSDSARPMPFQIEAENLDGIDPVVAERRARAFCDRAPHTILISTGGRPLLMNIRQFGVEVEIAVPKALIEPVTTSRLAMALRANRGHAGRAFLDYLVQPAVMLWARRQLVHTLAEIIDRTPDHTRPMPNARLMAQVYTAAIIVQKLGLAELSPTRILDWSIGL